MLAESDYVLLLLPSTAETEGSSTRRRWPRMKPSALLLNFGRGDLVVDADLVAAVSERRIAGAVLDVFTTEPLPAEHAFWTTPGIVVLPARRAACIPSEIRSWPRCGWTNLAALL